MSECPRLLECTLLFVWNELVRTCAHDVHEHGANEFWPVTHSLDIETDAQHSIRCIRGQCTVITATARVHLYIGSYACSLCSVNAPSIRFVFRTCTLESLLRQPSSVRQYDNCTSPYMGTGSRLPGAGGAAGTRAHPESICKGHAISDLSQGAQGKAGHCR